MRTEKCNGAEQFEQWAVERDRYVVLLHLYNIGSIKRGSSLTTEKITRDLGLSPFRAHVLLTNLSDAGYLRSTGRSEGLELTAQGMDYIQNRARRRQSLRLGTPLDPRVVRRLVAERRPQNGTAPCVNPADAGPGSKASWPLHRDEVRGAEEGSEAGSGREDEEQESLNWVAGRGS